MLLVSIPISFIAGILLGYKEDTWISLPVCYVWFTGIFLTYCLHLLDLGRFVLPASAQHGVEDEGPSSSPAYSATREGTNLLFFHSSRRLMPTPLRRRLGLVFREPPEGVPDSFGIYGAGMVPSHQALALGRGLGFTRAAGPGYVRLNRLEHIMETIDLRLQYRVRATQVVTRDGIPLNTSVSTLFHVKRPPNGEAIRQGEYPYPYTPETIFRLLYANSIDAEAEVTWSERLCPLIEAFLVSQVSQYNIDQLYQPPDGHVQPSDVIPIVSIRESVADQFQQELHSTFEFDREAENPLHVLVADFSELEPPEEIAAQRVQSWRTEWRQRQRQLELEAENEELLTRQAARARAELGMIQDVTEMIQTIHHATGADLSEVVVLRLIEALDQMTDAEAAPPPSSQNHAMNLSSTALDGGDTGKLVQELSRQLRQLNTNDLPQEDA